MASTASDTAAARPPSRRATTVIVSPKRGTPSAAVTCSPASADLRRTYHGDVEVLDLLAQRVAIEPQEAGSAQLIPARCPKGQGQQRSLNLGNDTIVHAVRWQTIAMGLEQCLQMAIHGVTQRHVRGTGGARGGLRLDRRHGVGQLGLDGFYA